MKVYLNFDGRILPKSEAFVPDFGILSAAEITDFVSTVATLVCNDPNVDGLGWDVEPFNNNQKNFFSELDDKLTRCGKEWGIFTFPSAMNADMWTNGLGNSGFLMVSTYDLGS
jgi:hypothetical protein